MDAVYFPFPDQEASRHILTQDPCYHKISSGQKDAVFRDAWDYGIHTAESFWNSQEEISSMRTLLTKQGFTVYEPDVDYVVGNTRYFCDYQSEKNIVNIYKKSIELWAENNGFSYDDSVELILAHEYFHYLEWHKIGLASKRCLVPMVQIGSWKLGKTGIAALSEIAANAFANRWYLLLIQSGKITSGLMQEQGSLPVKEAEETERSVKKLLKQMISI